MIFTWANKQLEKLSETMAPISNSATSRFITALRHNDNRTAQSLLSTNPPPSNPMDNTIGGMEYIHPHNTLFHSQRQTKAIHIICQYSNQELFTYILNSFYSNQNMNQILAQVDAVGNTILHYACQSTSPYAKPFVSYLVELYKSHNLQSIIPQKNHNNETAYDVSQNDLVRQYLLPVQLQFETQECLKNGGVGLPKGIDLGGLRIENRNMAPPPIMGGVSSSAGSSPDKSGGGNMYSMASSGIRQKYAMPTDYMTAPVPTPAPAQYPSPYSNHNVNAQYNTFVPGGATSSTVSTVASNPAINATPGMNSMSGVYPSTENVTGPNQTQNITTMGNESLSSTAGIVPATSPILADGWEELIDPSSNTPYYYNAAMNLTQWEKPIQDKVEVNRSDEMQPSATTAMEMSTVNPDANINPMEKNGNVEPEPKIVPTEMDGTSKEDDTNGDNGTKEEEKETSSTLEKEEVKKDEATDNLMSDEKNVEEEKVTDAIVENSNASNEMDPKVTMVDGTPKDTNDTMNANKESSSELEGEAKVEMKMEEKVEIEVQEDESNVHGLNTKDDVTVEKTREIETVTQDNSISQEQMQKLPAGWTQLYDESSGSVYYYNQMTNATQWEMPQLQELPSGWVELTDPTSGAYYYFNQQTNVTQWEKPVVVTPLSTTVTANITTQPKYTKKEAEPTNDVNTMNTSATNVVNPSSTSDGMNQTKSTVGTNISTTTNKSDTLKKSKLETNSAPSSASGYAKRGFSTAAVLPSNAKYKPDGFHSSSSDVNLQKKYGHDPNITAPPSGRSFNSNIAPPPSSGPSLSSTQGANPYASGGIMGHNRYAPSSGGVSRYPVANTPTTTAGYDNNSSYGYNSRDAQNSAYQPSVDYNQHSGMAASDAQSGYNNNQMNTAYNNQSQWAVGAGYNNQQQDMTNYSASTANQQQVHQVQQSMGVYGTQQQSMTNYSTSTMDQYQRQPQVKQQQTMGGYNVQQQDMSNYSASTMDQYQQQQQQVQQQVQQQQDMTNFSTSTMDQSQQQNLLIDVNVQPHTNSSAAQYDPVPTTNDIINGNNANDVPQQSPLSANQLFDVAPKTDSSATTAEPKVITVSKAPTKSEPENEPSKQGKNEAVVVTTDESSPLTSEQQALSTSQLFDSNPSNPEIENDKSVVKENPVTETVPTSNPFSSNVALQQMFNGNEPGKTKKVEVVAITVERADTDFHQASAASFFNSTTITPTSLGEIAVNQFDELSPPPMRSHDTTQTSELNNKEGKVEDDDILSPPPMMNHDIIKTNEPDNKNEINNETSLSLPPILTDHTETDPLTNFSSDEDLPPPPVAITHDDAVVLKNEMAPNSEAAESDDLLPPPPMFDIALNNE